MDVKELKPHVTMFSAEFPFRGKHHEEVIVGGEVKVVVENFFDAGAGKSMLVIADDALGELQLVVPKPIYDADAPGIGINVGSKILAKGRLHVHKGILHDKKESSAYQVIVRELKALPVME